MKNLRFTLLLVLSIQVVNYAQGSTPNPGTWVANGTVADILVDDGYTYIGGSFSYVGPNTGCAALVSSDGLNVNSNFPRILGDVHVIVPDGNGGWYVGGQFAKALPSTLQYLVRVNADGSLDTNWRPQPSNTVRTIVVASDAVYFGGDFTLVNGNVSRFRLAKVNLTDGTVDPLWNPIANNSVYSLQIDGADIYAGGDFTTVNTTIGRSRLAKFNNTNGAVDANWNPNASSRVRKILIHSGSMYLGGDFSFMNDTVTRASLAKVNLVNGLVDPGWDPRTDFSVYTIAINGDNFYAGGNFSTVNGNVNIISLAKFNLATGIVDASWIPWPNSSINDIKISGSDIYVAGAFSTMNGNIPRGGVAKLNNVNGGVDVNWKPTGIGIIRTLAFQSNSLYVGGQFSSFGGERRRYIARIVNSTGKVDMNWDPNSSSSIESITANGNYIYLSGFFNTLNGSVAAGRLGRVDKITGQADASWNPNFDGQVMSVFFDSTFIYVGGFFNNVNGTVPRKNLARINLSDASVDQNWNPNISSLVFVVKRYGDNIYIGGDFTTVNGSTTRNKLAKLNISTGLADPDWNPNASSTVYRMELIGGKLYIAGAFQTINGGLARRGFARLNFNTGLADSSWNVLSDGTGRGFWIEGNSIYIGGAFTSLSGQTQYKYAAKVDDITGLPLASWIPKLNGQVYAIDVVNDNAYVGGAFTGHDGYPQGYFALFDAVPSLPPLVTTGIAADIGIRQVTMNGAVNPKGTASKAYFEYGTTTSYGFTTDTLDVGSGNTAIPVIRQISGLTPNTQYHYRIVGFNAVGISYGADSMFTTLPQPAPVVTTLPADSIGIYSMRLKGTVNPQGDSTMYYFEYKVGASTFYTDTLSVGNGTTTVSVHKYLTGLFPNAGYSFKLIAFNSGGSTSGTLLGATTLLPPKPIAFTGSTNPITQTSGKMFGTINAQGDSTYWYFEYGTTTSYGMRTDTTYLGRSLTNVQVNKLITGLLPNTRYYYRIAAYNSAGLTNAGGTSFVTLNRVLTLTSPVGGEGYEPGSTTNIQWNAAAVDTIKIEYSSDNGNNWSLVVDNRVTTGGSYNWSVPSVLTTQGRIRLTSTGITPELVSDAAGVFTIASANLANSPSGTGSNLNASSFPNSGNGTAVGDSGTIVNTTNGGGSWTPPVTPMEGVTNKSLRSVSTPSIYTRITVGDSGRVFKSTNAGNNWTAVSTPTVQDYYSVAFTDTLNGSIAGGNGTILKTTNTGSNWVQQTSGTTKKLFGIYLTNNQLGTVVGEDGTILYTTDGGTNWSAQSSGTTRHLNGVWFVKNAGVHQIGYAVGDSGLILKTTNGGTAWTQLVSLTSKNLNTVAFTTPERGAAAGDGGVVIYTSDGGTVWKSLVGAGSTDINNIAVPNTGGVMYMAGSSGKIFKDTAGVVPVELTSFTASSANGKVTLTWITASELNNAGFDVERAESANREFAKIGEVTGKGTTTQTSEYIFTDEKAVRGKYVYRLKQRDYDGTFSYSPEVEAEVTIPMEFALSQNYPNPFNPSTHIKYQLPKAGNVLLEVYDIQGSLVRRLVNGKQEAGYYSITFEASNLPSGVYIYRLTSGRFTKTNKLMLMK